MSVRRLASVSAGLALAFGLLAVPAATAPAAVPPASAAVSALVVPHAVPAAKHYSNCTQLNKKYKHGVGRKGARDHVRGHTRPVTNFARNNAVYAANKGKDRDHDGIACEKR